MADRVTKVSYCYVTVPNRSGQGLKVLNALKEAGVNLLGFSAFPAKPGKAQIDLIPESMVALRRVAREHGWKLSGVKKGFAVHGADRVGAIEHHVRKLAAEKISITAADAMSAGQGRYGLILWVKPKDYNRAARLLRAK